jgi:hypothetical protein
LAGFIEGDGERLCGCIDMLDRPVSFNCAPEKDRRFSGAAAFRIIVFKGE